MIGNFQFNLITLDKLIDDGLHVTIEEWEKSPVSAMFTANVSGERYLTGYGHNLNVEIEIINILPDDITDFTELNGIEVAFKLDTDDPITYAVNCIVDPFKANGRPFYNAVKMSFKSITGNFETVEERISVISPIGCRNTDVPNEMYLTGFDSLGNEFIIEYL